MKICKKCGIEKELSAFNKKKTNKDGLQDWCRRCEALARKIYYLKHKKKLNAISNKYHEEHKEELAAKRRLRYINNIDEERVKNLNYYHMNKEARAIYAKKYAEKNKDRLYAQNKVWKANNKEKIDESREIYAEKNKEKIAKVSKEYREKHKEKLSTWKKKYNQEHKKEIAAWKKKYNQEHKKEIAVQHRLWRARPHGRVSSVNSHNKRRYQKIHTSDGSIPLKLRYPLTKELQEKLDKQKGMCYICSVLISSELGNIHLDHWIPLNKGGMHTLDNVVWLCDDCNLAKGDNIPSEPLTI